jgi:hypothetical protein
MIMLLIAVITAYVSAIYFAYRGWLNTPVAGHPLPQPNNNNQNASDPERLRHLQ